MNPEPKKSKSLELSLGIFIVLGLIASFFFWQDAKMKKRASSSYQKNAVNNARQIGFGLFEFENDYGSFPSAATRPLVERDHGTSIDLSGTSSNALFRQLFAAGYTQSEETFYAKIKGSIRPDGIITPGNILEPRECGFAYIAGLTAAGNPATPIVLAPVIPGTKRFDPKPFNGKAVVLHIDNSVRSYSISVDGHVYDKGIALLSPAHPIWAGKSPDIRYPE